MQGVEIAEDLGMYVAASTWSTSLVAHLRSTAATPAAKVNYMVGGIVCAMVDLINALYLFRLVIISTCVKSFRLFYRQVVRACLSSMYMPEAFVSTIV